MSPNSNCFLMKWQSTSICLIFASKTALEAMHNNIWLSTTRHIWELSSSIFLSRFSHMSSQVTNVIAAIDLVTTFCFLLFHDIKLFQKKTTPWSGASIVWWPYPVNIRIPNNLCRFAISSKHEAFSKSLEAFSKSLLNIL